jgi:hypothetical protein
MKLAIMQPYFFPYIVYWQLIYAVDTFVIYDDVNFIKQGWINRNRILHNGQSIFFTLHLKAASSFKLINDIEIGNNQKKLLKTLEFSYRRAAYFHEVFPIIETILTYPEKNLAMLLIYSIRTIADYLQIAIRFLISSELEKDASLKAYAKILAICRALHATHYINPIGGQELYHRDDFEREGLALSFLQTRPVHYQQFHHDYIPNLSIIDAMMFNSKKQIQAMLTEYDLI